MQTIASHYRGKCPVCQEAYGVGTQIFKGIHGYQHTVCPLNKLLGNLSPKLGKNQKIIWSSKGFRTHHRNQKINHKIDQGSVFNKV